MLKLLVSSGLQTNDTTTYSNEDSEKCEEAAVKITGLFTKIEPRFHGVY
jgi:hypothetical protein